MLTTPEERIKMLKKGLTGKEIEKLYIEYNDFKIVHTPVLIELVEFDIPRDKRNPTSKAAAVCALSCILHIPDLSRFS